jgi:hypothetical protein
MIRGALERVRRRLLWHAALRIGACATGLALLCVLAALVVAGAASAHRAPSLAGVLVGAGAIAMASGFVRFAVQARRWRDDRHIARFVGGSDLLSTVELSGADNRWFSPDLIAALGERAAAQVGTLDLATLLPGRALRAPLAFVTGTAALVMAAPFVAPDFMARGWAQAVGGAGSLAALSSAEPVVGDIEIRLQYPSYTGRPPTVLPGASGDFRALPGTAVEIRTVATRNVDQARLLFTPTGSPPSQGTSAGQRKTMASVPSELAMAVDGRQLHARFTVAEAADYRFYLRSKTGSIREEHPHKIALEDDATPTVELYAPADELDVEDRKRVELAYTAEDDYGIAEIALVWAAEGSTAAERMPLWSAAGDRRRSTQGKFLWDLADLPLAPGSRVGYHVEVVDNNSVTGPNIGRSRTFYLRVLSPHERHDQLVARQAELFEDMVRLLGGRLIVEQSDLPGHQALHRRAQRLVASLDALLGDLDNDELAGRDLQTALAAMRGRLGKLVAAEGKLLASKAPGPRLGASDRRNVRELERDVLTLADWIDRQRLESLLALTDEITDRRKRLGDLFEEFARTGSSDTRAEIERELRALEKAIAELGAREGRLSADVADQFVNMEAVQSESAQDCLGQVRRLLDAGQVEAAAAQMQRCNQDFESSKQQLEQALSDLRGERFAEQERKLNELTGELADLAQDEAAIAQQADEIMRGYSERAAELMKGKLKEATAKARKLAARLRKQLDRVPGAGLTPFAHEELPIVGKRLEDVERMLDDGDLAEALAMARQAELSLDAVEAELGADLDTGDPWSDRTPQAYNEIADAVPLARQLVKELDQATPRPEEVLDDGERRRLGQLGRRQQALRDRATRLADKARRMAKELPGNAGEAMSQGVDQAGEHMQRGEERMRGHDPSGARQQARAAADALEQALRDSQSAARGGAAQHGLRRDEPIRIPGSDDYRAPEEFREQILEAMKKSAPSGFAEQVKRYYEELIK